MNVILWKRGPVQKMLMIFAFVWILYISWTFMLNSPGTKSNNGGVLVPRSSAANQIHIVLNGDLKYLLGMIGVLNSTYSEASDKGRLKFHVMTIDEENVRLLTESFEKYLPTGLTQAIEYSIFPEKYAKELKVKVYVALRAGNLDKPIVYARYFFHKIFQDLDKVIYMDNDVVVKRDIVPMWEIDIGDKPIAAARLCRDTALFKTQFYYDTPGISSHAKAKELLKYDKHSCSLNNGVLIYNLKEWRKTNYEQELVAWTKANSEIKLWGLGSQPPFNLVFYKNYFILQDKWNLMDVAGLVHDYVDRIPKTRFSEEFENAVIIHWNGEYKPWHGEGPGARYWLRYVEGLPREMVRSEEKPPKQDKKYLVTGTVMDPSNPRPEDLFTTVIVSFSRVDTLKQVVDNVRKSPFLKEILVVWNNMEKPCPVFDDPRKVRCLQQKENLVHNRFTIWPEISTEAVFHIDDDTYLPVEEINQGFRLWGLFRERIMGYEPRRLVCLNPNQNYNHKPWDSCTYGFELKDGHFHFLIGKVFYVHRNYMQLYSETAGVRDYNLDHPCEDIAMNFLVASVSQRAHVWYKGHNRELTTHTEFVGLSKNRTVEEWKDMRKGCAQYYLDYYNGNPIPKGLYKAVKYHPGEDSFLMEPVQKGESWCGTKTYTWKCFQEY
eukprot:Nk52_evm3s361 gene=Nk52_evmTU3s361